MKLKITFILLITFCKLNFSFAEESNIIKVVSCHSPPYFFYENNKFKGSEVELLALIFRAMKVEYSFSITDCNDAVQKTEVGYFSVLLHNSIKKNESSNLLSSDPIFQMNHVFFRKKFDFTQSFLTKLTIGVPSGYSDISLKKNKNYNLVPVSGNNNYLNALLKVYFNEIDYFLCDQITCEYVIDKYKNKFPELNRIERRSTQLYEKLSRNAYFSKISSLNKERYYEFNSILKKIKKTYSYKNIANKYNIRNN
ncbi:transporter substrate-binding domain-containing protein [Pigmentibacter sp. JX0631]|uniref:substrate-binding periplasmic protein n=1 Tax=Pigmentibacter sp. JX0631 TaxID=2976982 RepID=UPI002469946A|nr:transporter substrate-binding domain-containing protein [Pigmentibacter sp. JX0631]WGL60336.1 transporter substrate-binding domain-containing protein [Pigmentibacter sp. JX0631]